MHMVQIFEFLILFIFWVGMFFSHGSAEPLEDKRALLDFLNNISHSRNLNWNQNSSACENWVGVTCSKDKSNVIALRLPGMNFRGSIPFNTLSRLSAIQSLSLRSNHLSGHFPSDFSKLHNLTGLFLQSNNFSDTLPETLPKDLRVLRLSDNKFDGNIPSSISNLTRLIELDLSSNQLSGEIPNVDIPCMNKLNLSGNNLSGNVPPLLQRFPMSSFSYNIHLVFQNNSATARTPNERLPAPSINGQLNPKRTTIFVLKILLGGFTVIFAVLAIFIVCCRSNGGKESEIYRERGEPFSNNIILEEQDKHNMLVFFDGYLEFELEDLLRASAEVLGKGIFGITYKTTMEDSTVIVVKRLKEVAVGKREFEQQMEAAGNIRHENVTPLRAYYYSNEEKLMMYYYYSCGSVAAMLHEKRRDNRRPLDWEARVRIAIGTARGISHIHTQNGGKLVHGNIKSSNIFLNSLQYGCVSDFGFATLLAPISPSSNRAMGNRAPEVCGPTKASQESDVYSFGVVLLELLTGKCPVGREDAMNLVRWVSYASQEEWSSEIMDIELSKCCNNHNMGKMVEMMKMGIACAATVANHRPKMREVVKMLENIQQAV